MSVKRRNHGRSKKNKGLAKVLRCNNCGRVAGKDKAIKRYTVRDIVDGSSLKDIKESLATPKMIIPKIYEKK
jgi:small subunit ribosomal protein S26e